MSAKSRKDLQFGIIVLVVGLVYLFLTMQLPRKAAIDSATVPYLLALLMCGLGVIQVVLAAKQGKMDAISARSIKSQAAEAVNQAPLAATTKTDYKTVLITAVLIFLYVALLDTFGFLCMSALYLFVQISVLTPNYIRKNYALYAVISVVASAMVYYGFLWAFDIMLPHGEVWYDLGIELEWYPF